MIYEFEWLSSPTSVIFGALATMEERDGQQFMTTDWSLVLAAPKESQAMVCKSLSRLCEHYRKPVLRYFQGLCGNPTEAEDLCQSFFERLIRDRLYVRATPERGRFRNFLITSAKNHFLNTLRNSRAQKRGAGVAHMSLDHEDAPLHDLLPAAETQAQQSFDYFWARTIFDTTWAELETSYDQRGQAERFQALRPFLSDPEDAPTQQSVADHLNLPISTVKAAAFELRKRFREIFRAHVARSIDDPTEVDAEIRHLVKAICNPPVEAHNARKEREKVTNPGVASGYKR